MAKYLKHFPSPVLRDLLEGRWLPVVGAGLSLNAVVPQGKVMPLWDDLGRQLAEEVSGYAYSNPIDAISAYAHEYDHARLVERIEDSLLIGKATPGEVHRAFCSLFFDIVCTTNLDFLLERQYDMTPRDCRPILTEEQLVARNRAGGTLLLKLHGDVHHPERMVVTEEDYDCFLDRYPLLATYLANLLITRTAVFIGYSLDDPDFRNIWQVIGDRLGKARRTAYAIAVNPRSTDIARFQRRGVTVIGLPGTHRKYAEILAATFDELREYVQENVISTGHVTKEEPLSELSLPTETTTRLCFFALPLEMQPLYREYVFPMAENAGLVPVTATEVVTPGHNYEAKLDALMRRSVAALFDLSGDGAIWELRQLNSVDPNKPRVAVVSSEAPASAPRRIREVASDMSDERNQIVLSRDARPLSEQRDFLDSLHAWFNEVAQTIAPGLAEEPTRLLGKREYRAAVIAAVSFLESRLKAHLSTQIAETKGRSALGLGRVARLAADVGLLRPDDLERLMGWSTTRNLAVHSEASVDRKTASDVVRGVSELVKRFDAVE
jgi:SIR2-like domain